MNIADNLGQIRKEIRALEAHYQRLEDSVELLAVSKTKPVEAVLAAVAAGQRHFGENYCQEAIKKITSINQPELVWHFIGPIQSNKTSLIASHFDWVHTLDRTRIARRLHEARPASMKPLNVCVQINISGEISKSGIHIKKVPDFIGALTEFNRLCIRGLMALPAPSATLESQRQPFHQIAECCHELKTVYPQLDTLSFGTTQDMEAAIAEGSTIVRIGTAIFGRRDA